MFLSTGVPVVVTLTTFASYIFGRGQSPTASTFFTSLSLFGLLREAVSKCRAFVSFAESL